MVHAALIIFVVQGQAQVVEKLHADAGHEGERATGVAFYLANGDACASANKVGYSFAPAEIVIGNGHHVNDIFVCLPREDCAGLRAYLNESMPQISAGMEEELIPMNQLGEDEAGVIVKVAESLRGVRRFADLGLIPGTEVTIAGYAPFGDLIRIKVLGSSLSLRSSDAGYIWVRPVVKK